jgi:PAS domain S-box-containing protein
VANLIVLNGLRSGTIVPLEGEVVVGRSAAVQVRIPDSQVSSSHLRILVTSEGIQVEDLNSTNGTFLNGAPLRQRARLRLGDMLVVGETTLLVSDQDQPPASESGAVARSLVGEAEDPTQVLLISNDDTEVILGDSDTFGPGMRHMLPAVEAVQQRLSKADSLEELYRLIAETFLRSTNAQRVQIILNDEEPPIVFSGRAVADGGVRSAEPDFVARADLVDRGLSQRGASIAREIQGGDREPSVGTGTDVGSEVSTERHAMCVALPSSAGLLGAVYLIGIQPLDREDLRLLLVMATLAGDKLRTQRLLQRVQDQNDQLRRLRVQQHEAQPSDPGVRALAGVPDAIVTVTREGEVTSWNGGAERLYGYAAQDVVGLTLPTVPDEGGAELEKILEAVALGRGLSARTERVRASGQRIPVEATYAPVLEKGEVVGIVEVARDLGPRLKEEERLRLVEREASYSEVARTLAHELGNPLANLHSGVEWLLARPRDAEDQRQALCTLRDEIDRLQRLAQQTLELARWRLPEPKPLCAEELLSYVAATHAVRAQAQGVGIEHSSAVDVRLFGDADQLKQALFNLVDNALAAMPEGGNLELACEVEGDATVLLVGDTGPGIPHELRSRVFDTFFSTRAGGSGVGLAVVRRIVQLHGGSVRLESGQLGTTFYLRFPGIT